MAKIWNAICKVKWKHFVNYIAIGIVGLIFSIMTLTTKLPMSTTVLLETITLNIVLAVSLSLVVGFLGELSLGHAGFMCIGAYAGGIISCIFKESNIEEGKGILTFIVSMIIGAVVAGIFGFLVGLPALRLKGDYLAIVTLAFGEIVKTVLENLDMKVENGFNIRGALGMRTPRFDKDTLFIIGFVLVLLTVFIVQNLIRSKHGRAITAIRDNEIAARASGINVTKYKLMGFVISAALAGIAGVYFSFANYNVKASVFDYNYSIEILIMVVLGGMGNVSGAIISATAITWINTELQTSLTGELAVLKDIIYALILVIIIIYNNAPGLKFFRERFNLRRGIDWIKHKVLRIKHDASHEKDDESAWDRVPTKIEMNEVLSTDFVVVESTQNPDKEDK